MGPSRNNKTGSCMLVVFGAVNLDIIVSAERLPGPGETVFGGDYGLGPGGKAANQALAARRAGAAAHLVARVGDDGFADLALANLRQEGVDITAVTPCAHPTGIATICVDGQGENQIVIAGGANLALEAGDIPEELLTEETLFLLQMEARPETNWAAIARARERGCRIALNVAPVASVPSEILDTLSYLIVNEPEARAVATGEGLDADDPERLARILSQRHDMKVIITLGSAGALACDGENLWRVGPLPVRAVDTTGAGDSFTGYFLAAIDAGCGIDTALRRASIAGALACTRFGAQAAIPALAEVQARLASSEPACRRIALRDI